MKRAFADTLYWIGITFDHDPWHHQASDAREHLGEVTLVTTDEVLVEFLAALSGAGMFYRKQAALMARSIMDDENVVVLPQSRQSFLDGLSLYERRADKGYSLTDCISMNTCRAEGVTEVLTNDHHFTQEGFTVLITRECRKLNTKRHILYTYV